MKGGGMDFSKMGEMMGAMGGGGAGVRGACETRVVGLSHGAGTPLWAGCRESPAWLEAAIRLHEACRVPGCR